MHSYVVPTCMHVAIGTPRMLLTIAISSVNDTAACTVEDSHCATRRYVVLKWQASARQGQSNAAPDKLACGSHISAGFRCQ